MRKEKPMGTVVLVIAVFVLSTHMAWGQGPWWPPGPPLPPPFPKPFPPFPGGVEPSKPKLSVNRDGSGRVTAVTNLMEEEVTLENGLTLGPRASLDLGGSERIISGYVIRDGIKYTDEGNLENLTAQEVKLSMGEKHVILGPKAAMDNKGNILKGYIIVKGHKLERAQLD